MDDPTPQRPDTGGFDGIYHATMKQILTLITELKTEAIAATHVAPESQRRAMYLIQRVERDLPSAPEPGTPVTFDHVVGLWPIRSALQTAVEFLRGTKP